jgi:hypothetical protein
VSQKEGSDEWRNLRARGQGGIRSPLRPQKPGGDREETTLWLGRRDVGFPFQIPKEPG